VWWRVRLCCENETLPFTGSLGVSGGTVSNDYGMNYNGTDIFINTNGAAGTVIVDASELTPNYCNTITCPSNTPTPTLTPTVTPSLTSTVTPTVSITPSSIQLNNYFSTRCCESGIAVISAPQGASDYEVYTADDNYCYQLLYTTTDASTVNAISLIDDCRDCECP
jgi:hypothetical protein